MYKLKISFINYETLNRLLSATERCCMINVLLFKLNTFQILKDEMHSKMTKFKTTIQQKLSGTLSGEFISVYNEINTIRNLKQPRKNKKDLNSHLREVTSLKAILKMKSLRKSLKPLKSLTLLVS